MDPRLTTAASFQSNGPFVAAYELLLSGLLFAQNGKPLNVVAITSTHERAGATTTAINLSLMVARTGRNVLLVDFNLRHPNLHSAFGVEAAPGLADALAAGTPPANAVRETGTPGLFLLTAGGPSVLPQVMLNADRLGSCISDLRSRFPFIILDTPPVLTYPDALNIGRVSDGVVLVVLAQRTSPRALQEARRRLDRAEIKVLGAVLNRVSMGEMRTSAK